MGVKSGSSMSDKQLARSVLDGRLLTFCIPSIGIDLKGYLAGRDDYHWLVTTTDLRFFLVHKSAPLVEISALDTYGNEPEHVRIALDPIIGPFRRQIEREDFGRCPKSQGSLKVVKGDSL